MESAQSPQDAILNHANTHISKAIELDHAGDIAGAIKAYEDGIKLMKIVHLKETNPEKKIDISVKIAHIEGKIEGLKAPKRLSQLHNQQSTHNQRSTSPQPSPSGRPEEIITFNVAIQIDRVKVFILHQGAARHVINDGAFPIRILKGEQVNASGHSEDIVFLQITEDMNYPLNPEIPCLRISTGHYVLPAPEHNSFYGLQFPSNTPPAFLHLFEQKLDMYCCFKRQDNIIVEEPSDAVVPVSNSAANNQVVVSTGAPLSPAVEKVAQGIEIGSRYIAEGVQTAGNFVKRGLEAGSSYIVSKIDPGTENARVPEALKKTVAAAKVVSPIAVKVSKTVVQGVAAVAGIIGQEIGHQIHQKFSSPSAASGRGEILQNALHIGKAAVFGASTIWDGLTDAGRTMLDGAEQASGKIVKHKLGAEAGEFVHDSFAVGKDLYEINAGLKSAGLKGITKSVAKTAAVTYAHRVVAAEAAKLTQSSVEGKTVVLEIADSPSSPSQSSGPLIEELDDSGFLLIEDESRPKSPMRKL